MKNRADMGMDDNGRAKEFFPMKKSNETTNNLLTLKNSELIFRADDKHESEADSTDRGGNAFSSYEQENLASTANGERIPGTPINHPTLTTCM